MNVTNTLTMKKNATLKFSGCTKVRIKNDLNADDNATINPDGYGVMFDVNDNVEFHRGANVQATIYAPNGTIHVASAPGPGPKSGSTIVANVMTGKFIAKDINGDDNTYWYESTACPCSSGSGGANTLKSTTTDQQTARTVAPTAVEDASAFMIKHDQDVSESVLE
jgi:hypothetical protein